MCFERILYVIVSFWDTYEKQVILGQNLVRTGGLAWEHCLHALHIRYWVINRTACGCMLTTF